MFDGTQSAGAAWRLCIAGVASVLAGALQAAPVPSVSISGGGSVLMGTDPVSLTVTFDNGASPGAGNVGYGPFVDLYLPATGADGASLPHDGVRYIAGSARYLGVVLADVIQTFPAGPLGASGCAAFQSAVVHPYARGVGGTAVPVCGTPGDQLVTLRLPTASVTPLQPPASIRFEASVSPFADQLVPLQLRAEGGFSLGSDPVAGTSIYNPAGFTATTQITPTVLELAVSPSGSGVKGTTGPGFPATTTLTLTAAPGQTVRNLELSAYLDDNIVITGIAAPGAGSITLGGAPAVFPLGPVLANGSANRLVVAYPSLSGSASVNIASYLPLQDASGAMTLNPVDGAGSVSELRVKAVGDWQPLDPRDPAGSDNALAGDAACPACPATSTRAVLALPVRKSVTNLSDGNNSPGDILRTTLSIQLSDYLALDDLKLIEVLSDGQRLSGTPQFAYTQHGTPASGAVPPAAFQVREYFTGGAPGTAGLPDPDVSATAGETVLAIDLSAMLAPLGRGEVLGGCVPVGGTGGAPPNCLVFNGGPTTVTLTYETTIQDGYTDAFPSGDASLDLGDALQSRAVVKAATVLNTANLAPTGAPSAVLDDSAAAIAIARGALATTLYAVTDGNTGVTTLNPLALASVAAGDVLTFRLLVELPSADFEDLQIWNFLPLPLLDAREIVAFNDIISNGTSDLGSGIPAGGQAMWGPTAAGVNFRNRLTFLGTTLQNGSTKPTVTIPGGTVPAACGGSALASSENVLNFCFGDFDDPLNEPLVIDILFSISVDEVPVNGARFSNLARLALGATNAPPSAVDALTVVSATVGELSISVDDGLGTATPGASLNYSIVAANAGPDPVVGATVADTFPAPLSCSWTCAGTNGGVCTAAGAGNLHDRVDLPVGASVHYSVVCAIAASATGVLSNVATVSAGASAVDPNPINNSATEVTTLAAVADLQISKSDGVATSTPGGSTSYLIQASNLGPSDTTAQVADAFPPTLTCSWACVGANGAVCTAAGSGPLNDAVSLPSGASVAYTATCAISAAASGTLVNTATVTGAATDPNPGNNSATDTNTILPPPELSISDLSQIEGSGGSTDFTFNVWLSAPAPVGGVRFDIATIDGTALAPGDYQAIALPNQRIPEGQTSYPLTIRVVADNLIEANEAFVVELRNVTGAELIDGVANGTILDDDTATHIQSTTPDPSVVGQPYNVAVDVMAGAAAPVGTVTISDGGVSCGPAALVTVSALSSSASCTLSSLTAGARQLTATFAPASAAFVGSSGSASHQVDPASTTISVSGPARARIHTPTPFSFALSVNAPGGGTPTGMVTLSSGSSSCQVSVPTANSRCDLSFDLLGPRTVSASFISSDGHHLASGSSGAGNTQTLVYAQSDLVVSKTDTVTSYADGELLVYTIQLRNLGPDRAANLRLRDPVPAGLVDAYWSCDASGGAACPASLGSGDIDAQIPDYPVGALLNYTFFGSVAGNPQQILNTATLSLDGTVEDNHPANNSASDLNTRNLLLADGFEAVTVSAASGSQLLPGAALRALVDATARAVLTLNDADGQAARVYARVFEGQLQYALAERQGNARLRLRTWRNYSADPQLRWTATAQPQGFVVLSVSLD